MFKRITSLMLVTALIVLVCGSASQARASDDEVQPVENSSSIGGADKQANEKLRTAFNKVLEDARAGKLAPAPRPQIQPQKSNNLSKTTKIAIGVAIAVAVIAFIYVKVDKAPSGSFRIL